MELAGIEPASAECALAFIGIETFLSPMWLSMSFKKQSLSISVDDLIFFHIVEVLKTPSLRLAVYAL